MFWPLLIALTMIGATLAWSYGQHLAKVQAALKFNGNPDGSFSSCKEDLEHHNKVLGTAPKG